MNFYLQSFLIFLKIGLFTIGGGYAMVPLIQDEIVDKRKWIDKEDFIDLLALTQSVPGIFAVNIAIFIGYKLRKFRGALAMALGTIPNCREYIQGNSPGGSSPYCSSHFLHGKIRQDKPLHCLDTNSIRIAYLGIGRIPCLHYHNSGRGGFYIWQVQT